MVSENDQTKPPLPHPPSLLVSTWPSQPPEMFACKSLGSQPMPSPLPPHLTSLEPSQSGSQDSKSSEKAQSNDTKKVSMGDPRAELLDAIRSIK